MDEEEIIQHRDFDRSSTKFQSKEQGKVVKSLRKFGVEVEMYHNARKAVNTLSKTISRVFGVEHDGSIDAGGGIGVEVVSPILRGAAGEDAIVDLFKTINALDFKINKTCGLHVHLDGKGFAQGNNTSIATVGSYQDDKFLSSIHEDDYAFVVKRDVMEKIVNRSGMGHAEVMKLIADEYFTTEGNVLFLSKELGVSVPEIHCRAGGVNIGNSKAMLDVFSFVTNREMDDARRGIVIGQNAPNDDDYMCVVGGSRNLKNILTLLYLHTVYSDVFMAMLPKSRRQDNLYCQSLSLGFSAGQIESIQSYKELEAAWYKAKTQREVQRRKHERYDESRYFSVNLHSLFAKYGTIEIRSHTATLDPNKVLYWVAFHQEILDRIVSGDITMAMLRDGSTLFDIEAKTSFLLSVLGLRTPLRKYMEQRINYFKANETK